MEIDILIWCVPSALVLGYVLGIYVGRNFNKFTEE